VERASRAPFFPVGPDVFRAATEYRDFQAGETLAPHQGVAVRTARLHHPNGATGYRVEWDGKAICYITDHEHGNRRADGDVLRLMERADIAIYDATYTDEEYPEFKGYGHSTWQVGARLCREAGVRTYVPFHHRGRRTDDDLAHLESEARQIHPGTRFARESVVMRP
jgi:phosphoribosyl 1,2-cyclic phosphodiesterase